jgi:hypothetical protein
MQHQAEIIINPAKYLFHQLQKIRFCKGYIEITNINKDYYPDIKMGVKKYLKQK